MLYNLLIVCLEIIPMIIGYAFLLRFWTQKHQISVPTNIARYLIQMTDWLVKPLRKALPIKNSGIWAPLVASLLIALLRAVLEASFFSAGNIRIILFLTLMSLLQWICYGFMAILLIEAIFSWINPLTPFAFFIREMTSPLLSPIRKIIPTLGRFDFSPMIAFFLLQIALRLISQLLSRLI